VTKCGNVEQLLQRLAEKAKPVSETEEFSRHRGIYGFFLSKGCLHIGNQKITPGRDKPLYIGKTESGQKARDLGQHLADGGTKHSTLRRSLGALLREQLNLKPRPRSATETSPRRFTNFKFDAKGEAKLTKWMMENLKVGFVDFRDSDCGELKDCEQALITSARPPLNIIHNSDSPYRKEILSLRRHCARLAGAAARAGHLSPVASNPAPVYRQLADALKQLKITPESE
jgi:GIY-YIG catalytic domain